MEERGGKIKRVGKCEYMMKGMQKYMYVQVQVRRIVIL